MKKRLFLYLLCAAILLSFSPTVMAANGNAGFYNLGSAQRIEIRPVTASGGTVSMVERDADGDGENDGFYPDSEALEVTLSDTAQGEMYLLTLSSPDNTLYVDQRLGGEDMSFRVAFTLPDSPTALFLEIGSSEAGFEKIAVSLFYTPSASVEPDEYPDPAQTDNPQPETVPIENSEQETIQDYVSCEKDAECPMRAFSDLDPDEWYHDGVHYALEHGIMNGVGEALFDPYGSASRGMIVTILWRLEGMPEAENASFSDVPSDAWYAKAVSWTSSEHIVEGYDAESFGPDDPISREQLALILWRYAKYKGADKLGEEKTSIGLFIDAEQISSWAFDGMQWAVNSGLISGTDTEHLSPKTYAGRAQIAAILMRYSGLK